MDKKLDEIITKHAEKQGIDKEEALKIYNDYNRSIKREIMSIHVGNYQEIRIPFIARLVFNSKKYEKYKESRKQKETGESKLKD